MIDITNPAWWATLAGVILGAFGVADPGMQGDVKSVVAGGVGIIIAVYTHEHHATKRAATVAAAAGAQAQATMHAANQAVSAAQITAQGAIIAAQSTPAPARDVTTGTVEEGTIGSGVQPGAKQFFPLPGGPVENQAPFPESLPPASAL